MKKVTKLFVATLALLAVTGATKTVSADEVPKAPETETTNPETTKPETTPEETKPETTTPETTKPEVAKPVTVNSASIPTYRSITTEFYDDKGNLLPELTTLVFKPEGDTYSTVDRYKAPYEYWFVDGVLEGSSPLAGTVGKDNIVVKVKPVTDKTMYVVETVNMDLYGGVITTFRQFYPVGVPHKIIDFPTWPVDGYAFKDASKNNTMKNINYNKTGIYRLVYNWTKVAGPTTGDIPVAPVKGAKVTEDVKTDTVDTTKEVSDKVAE